MQKLMKLQKQLADAQQSLSETEVTGTSGGGLVTVVMTAAGEIRSFSIDPKAVDADDVETLEDLLARRVAQRGRGGPAVDREDDGPLTGGLGGLGLPGF